MGPIADRVFVAVVLGGLAAWVAWGFVAWVRNRPVRLSPAPVCSLAGFTFASLSAALEIGSGLYAQFTDGFPFNDPTLLRIYGLGLLTALLGLIFALFGATSENPLRWKASGLSVVLLLLWFGQVIGE
jgi:hypothetical protein